MLVCRILLLTVVCLLLFRQESIADEPVLPVTNVTHEDIARAATGATLENMPGGLLAILYPASTVGNTIYEARHGGSYDQIAVVYAPLPRQRKLMEQVILLHYRTADTDIAHQATRLFCRLMRLHRQHFGRDAAFPRTARTAEVWLNAPASGHASDVGGETWTQHIYLFQTPTPRKPIEWTRTIVHEWGHLTLSAARGFTDPETDAAGFLGERLFFKWLREDQAVVADDFVQKADLDLYYHRQVAPLIQEFQEGGPGSSLFKDRNTAAMDYYVGAALAADDAFGSRTLGRALFSIESDRPAELNRTLRVALENSASFRVALPAWVPLEAGEYAVKADAADGLLIADRPSFDVSPAEHKFNVILDGWKWMRVEKGEAHSVTFRLTDSRTKSEPETDE